MIKNFMNFKYSLHLVFIALVLLVKGAFFHFHYYPFLDDWHLLGEPNLYRSPIDFMLENRTYVFRPVFALLSVLLVAPMWNYLSIWFFIICFIHALNGLLLARLLGLNNNISRIPFLVVFGLYPLAFEAEYWLSASFSLVIGLFVLLLSAILLERSFDRSGIQKFLYYVSSFILLLLAFGSYEQLISFGMILFLMLILTWKRLGKSVLFASIVTGLSFLIITSYYLYFAFHSSRLESRLSFVHSFGDLLHNIKVVLQLISNIWFGKPSTGLITNGILRGYDNVVNYHAYAFSTALLIITIGLMALYFRGINKNVNKNVGQTTLQFFVKGLLLFFAGYGPFYVSHENWISNRSTYVPLIGVALILAAIVSWSAMKRRLVRIFIGLIITVYIISMSLIGVSEIVDYKNSSQFDQKVIDHSFIQAKNTGNQKICLINAKYSFTQQNSLYHEHIQSSLSVPWAANSITSVMAKKSTQYDIIPVIPGIAVAVPDLRERLLLGVLDDGDVIHLNIKEQNDGTLFLIAPNGKSFGTLSRSDSVVVYKP